MTVIVVWVTLTCLVESLVGTIGTHGDDNLRVGAHHPVEHGLYSSRYEGYINALNPDYQFSYQGNQYRRGPSYRKASPREPLPKTECLCDCWETGGPAEQHDSLCYGCRKETYERGCEWITVFKAVQGNGHNVYNDWINGGALNMDNPTAKDVDNTLVYRNSAILDRWDHLFIKRIKIEIFEDSILQAWYYFDGSASTLDSWMSSRRLIASPYKDLKTAPLSVFSVKGENEERRFSISRSTDSCNTLCGYLLVVNPASSHECDFERRADQPFFLYNTRMCECGVFSDPSETGIGDRLVISVKVCGQEL